MSAADGSLNWLAAARPVFAAGLLPVVRAGGAVAVVRGVGLGDGGSFVEELLLGELS